MGVYRRRDSPHYWMSFAAPGRSRVYATTGIPIDAPTAVLRLELRKQAQAVYLRAEAEYVLSMRDVAKPAIRLDKFLDWYDEHVTATKRGAAREREILKRLRKDLGELMLHELTKDRLLEWRARRAQMKHRRRLLAPATVNREFEVLRHALNQAVPTYLASSPATDISPLVAPPRAETQVLSPDDEAKLLAELKPADQAIVIAALDTLARAGDLLRLEWQHDHGKYLTILRPKTGTSYRVHVSSRLRAALNKLRRRGRFVFAHRRKATTDRLRTNSLKQMLEKACKRAGVAYGRGHGITFHALRHTGASRMIEGGANIETVRRLGGWSSYRMLGRYMHPTEASLTEAVGLVGAHVPATTPQLRKGKVADFPKKIAR